MRTRANVWSSHFAVGLSGSSCERPGAGFNRLILDRDLAVHLQLHGELLSIEVAQRIFRRTGNGSTVKRMGPLGIKVGVITYVFRFIAAYKDSASL